MKISQREAQRLRKRVQELERLQNQQRQRWVQDYPGGIHLGSLPRKGDWLTGRIEASRMLGRVVVVTENGKGELAFYAVK